MKCPYAVTRNRKVISRTIYDDEGKPVGDETVETNIAVFVDCETEKCGAWDGKCNYGGKNSG